MTTFKAVRFSPTLMNAAPASYPRSLTPAEAWSLYYFENHARSCPACFNPLEVYRRGRKLCDSGRTLGAEASHEVFYQDGLVYSTHRSDGELVCVDLPRGYNQLLSYLKAVSRYTTRPMGPTQRYSNERATYIVQPSKSTRRPPPVVEQPLRRNDPIHTPRPHFNRVDDDIDALPIQLLTINDRRGTQYARDMQRKQTPFTVEIREPPVASYRRRRPTVYV